MASVKSQKRDRSYHDLKLSGRFSAEVTEALVDTAVAISLRRKYDSRIRLPIENLFLYDVNHHDTGRERFLSKSYGNTPIYETTRTKLNEVPLIGSLALSGVHIDGLGASRPSFAAYGVLGISRPDYNHFETSQRETIQNVLRENPIIQILGRITGHAVEFGDPTPMNHPNEDHDDLIIVGSFPKLS